MDRCTAVLEKSQKKGKDTQRGISLCLDQEDGEGAQRKKTGKSRYYRKTGKGAKTLCASLFQKDMARSYLV